MDNEMIERCASAITESRLIGNDSSIDMTLACIKAMREPTEKMVSAGMDGDSLEVGSSAYGCWQDMIDAVIND